MNTANNNARPIDFKEMWSIRIVTGNSPLLLKEESQLIAAITRKDVTDIPAKFVADPFMIRVNDIWYLFMEMLNLETGLGEIGLVTSLDGITWTYQQVVLKESFHLSYPFVFEHEGSFYMVPETLEAQAVRLYKATAFPYNWEYQTNLLEGQYTDPTFFQHNERWWMMADSSRSKYNTLNLFYADQLKGPYTAHSQSPIIKDNNRGARPAGRINYKDGKLIRLAQDCYPIYGTSVRAFEIIELTTKSYIENELSESPILSASKEPKQWNSRGMHHIDAHQLESDKWIACIDGCYYDTEIFEVASIDRFV
jgi:hypothetical protein